MFQWKYNYFPEPMVKPFQVGRILDITKVKNGIKVTLQLFTGTFMSKKCDQ